MFCPQINKKLAGHDVGESCKDDGEEPPNPDAKTEEQKEKEKKQQDDEDILEDEDQEKVHVSDSIAERIESDGRVDEERRTCYDNYWINKLATIDKCHTEEKLQPDKALTILNKLMSYTDYRSADPCETEVIKLTRCLMMHKGQAMRCLEYAEDFKNCVDRTLHGAVEESQMDHTQPKKGMTYSERFEQDRE